MKQTIVVVIAIVTGSVLAGVLAFSRKPPRQKPPQVLAPLVRVQRVAVQDVPVAVRGYGTVRPRVQIQLVPQVAGKVVGVHPNLVNGGFVTAGEILIQIDPTEYSLKVEIEKAEVARANVRLQQELAEAEVARAEWEEMNPGVEPQSPLTLREPHIEQARAELSAAKARLATAELNLQRTRLTLPFNGRITQEKVDVSQYLVAGQPVATVYGTDMVEIVVPLEDKELAWFDIPGEGGWTAEQPPTPAKANVFANFANARHRWTGRVARTQGQIDEASRMVHLVVEVDNPFTRTNGRPPLVPGMFVEITIQGRTLRDVVPIPRSALHSGAEVWVVEDGRLHIRRATVARLNRHSAYLVSGLRDGEMIVLTPLDVVTDGMQIRTRREPRAEEPPGDGLPGNPEDGSPGQGLSQPRERPL